MRPLLEDLEAARSTARWGVEPHEYRDPEAFLATTEFADGVHTIRGGAAPIDFLMRLRPGRPLILSFHGNTPRNDKMKLPIFTGLNVTKDLDASFVAISDPSLHLHPDLKLAWFAGCDGLDLQTILPALLGKIITASEARDVICFGGSGGGFASLYYSAAIPNSIALVWNPQTDITRYFPPLVAEYGSAAFGFETFEAVSVGLGSLVVSDLATAYAGGHDNKILYLQNNSDSHVIGHMRPFLASLGADVEPLQSGARTNGRVADGVWLFLDNWGEGHAAPPIPTLGALLEGIVSDPPNWRDDFDAGRLARTIERTFGRALVTT
jgi:hypothetical protein